MFQGVPKSVPHLEEMSKIAFDFCEGIQNFADTFDEELSTVSQTKLCEAREKLKLVATMLNDVAIFEKYRTR